ncbi:MAG: hypothetical protein Q4A81_08915 [Pasteurellaceae bacterium]|nr:hypothetical protein [Pasteurellaceae bacterium]
MALKRKSFFKKNRNTQRIAQRRRTLRLKHLYLHKAKIADRHALYFMFLQNDE